MTTLLTLVLAAGAVQDAQENAVRIEELVRDLGSEDYDARERATEELRRIGREAIPYLERAAQDADPERAGRAQTLLDELRGGGRSEETQEHSPFPGLQFQGNFTLQIMTPEYTITIGSDGVRMVERATGQTYEAPSMDEFRERYPELADRLPNIRMTPDLGDLRLPEMPRFENWEPFGGLEEWQGLQEDLERRLEEMRERLFGDLERFRGRGWGEQPFEDFFRRGEPRSGAPRREAREAEMTDAEIRELGFAFEPNPAGEGLRVIHLVPVSPAQAAGLREGDIVVAVNGNPVTDRESASRRAVQSAQRLGEVTYTLLRDGERVPVNVEADWRHGRDF